MESDPPACCLKNKNGEYLTVQKCNSGRELRLVSVQDEDNEAPLVFISQKGDQFAFGFQRQSGRYYPKVCGKKLEFTKHPAPLTESNWFEREKIGSDHYFLRSVVTPDRCLIREQHVGLPETEPIELTHSLKANTDNRVKKVL
ncbi:uncharacterized protein AB9W97_013620 [Spinachia spinachia]